MNNVVEQDHRFIKRLTKPGLSFQSCNTLKDEAQALSNAAVSAIASAKGTLVSTTEPSDRLQYS